MKVVFLTNFLTHHQTPFCEAMFKKLGNDFKLVVMRSTDVEQKKLGYKELNDVYPFVIKTYENNEAEKNALSACEEADVLIWGSAPEKYVLKRRQQNKLIFIYTERIFKNGMLYAFYPPMIKYMYRKYTAQRNKRQYYLCASSYTSHDINIFTNTPNKFFKWGYFPKTKRYNDVDDLIAHKKKNSIIWVARYIKLKHPEIAVEIARRLKKQGYEFEVNMIGNGELLDEISKKVNQEGLNGNVYILGEIQSDKVREYMEKSEIHIFTSDRREGWGAVLNESMNSACAVVANRKIGAAPFLLDDGKNGYTYKSIDELYEKITYLMDNPEARKMISKNAYRTITQEWNAETATERFLELSQGLMNGETVKYENGPCSRAEIL